MGNSPPSSASLTTALSFFFLPNLPLPVLSGAAPGSVIVYADPSADLTEIVIDRLNRETE